MAALGFVALLALGVAQAIAAYASIDHHFGAFWAIAAIAVGVLFRFTLPVTIGAFFGAMEVWHWPWPLAALFAAPGLLLMVPGALATLASFARRW